jgi:hypothetical protein
LIKFKWYVWLLALLPGVAVWAAAISGVLDSRYNSSRAGVMLSGMAITFVSLAVLGVMARPWRVANLWQRTIALAATGFAVAAAFVAGVTALSTIQEELFAGTVKGVRAVSEFNGGLIAVGTDDAGQVAVWQSPDGEHWNRVEDSAELDAVDVSDLIVFNGAILVIGQAEETGQGVVLVSSDGTSWSRSPTFGYNLNPESGIEMTSLLEDLATTAAWQPEGIASTNGSLVMVGDTYGNAVVFWHSTDSVVWIVADPLPVFDTGDEVIDVVAWEHGFVAVGFDGGGEPQVWTSKQGTKWTSQDTQLEGRSLLAAAGDDAVVVVANSDSGATVWKTNDGALWVRQDSRVFHAHTVDAITNSTSGFAAVGVEASTGDASLWTSSDGENWTLTPHQPALGDIEIHDIVPFGVSFVAVGYDRDTNTAAFWLLDEQSGWKRIAENPAVSSLE